MENISKQALDFTPLPPSDAVRKQRKNILQDLFRSVLSQFKNIIPLET